MPLDETNYRVLLSEPAVASVFDASYDAEPTNAYEELPVPVQSQITELYSPYSVVATTARACW
jgi:hypothetical protein